MDHSLPGELVSMPLTPIAFVGIIPGSELWSHVVENRGVERVSIRILSTEDDFTWPNMKPKRSNYEWFIPKGILKKNWMYKHLYCLPAVVAIFIELDWSAQDFNDKKMQCAAKVRRVRTSLAGRNTKLAVVLIQRDSTLPSSEDLVASERASSLCSACELSHRSLFVLPVTSENLHGYILRLENALFDLAQNYYHQELRTVKAHRDYLNKTTHLYLYVRHQFKAGFLNELKKDLHAAYKHYGQAYSLLMEVRATDSNIMEVKTVAGFICYKICKLAFKLNLPRDAISHFRKHMDIFFYKVGTDELAFEHKGWQAKQCEFFADIFSDAIKNGLPAIQTQHPGLYYQQAAEYAIARRELIEENSSENMTYPSPDPLENIGNLEFYGQRPWRPGSISLEPPNPVGEMAGIQALLLKEKAQLESDKGEIIELLQKAIDQFKAFKSPRSESHLTVKMAEQFKSAHRYKDALVLLQPVIDHYRTENWRSILDAVLSLACKCAFLLCDARQFVALSLDLASKASKVSAEEKEQIMENVVGLFDCQVPSMNKDDGDSTSDKAAIEKATKTWESFLYSKPPPLIFVDVGCNSSSIELTASFSSHSYTADQEMLLEVYLQNHSPFTLAITELEVETDSEYEIRWRGQASILPWKGFRHSFILVPRPNDVNKALTLKRMWVKLGKQLQPCHLAPPQYTKDRDRPEGVVMHLLSHQMHLPKASPTQINSSLFSPAPIQNAMTMYHLAHGKLARLAAPSSCEKDNIWDLNCRLVPCYCQVILQAFIPRNDDNLQENFLIPTTELARRQLQGDQADFVTLPEFSSPISKVIMKQRNPQMTLDFQMDDPILIGEWFPILIHLTNNDNNATDVVIKVSLLDAQDPLIADTSCISLQPERDEEEGQIVKIEKQLGSLVPNGAVASQRVFVHTSTSGIRRFKVEAAYDVMMNAGVQCRSTISKTFKLNSCEPFQLTCHLLSSKMQDMKFSAFTDEHFFVSPRLEGLSDHSLRILGTGIELRPPLQFDHEVESQLQNSRFYPRSKTKECFPVIIKQDDLTNTLDSQDISLGKYVVRWQRCPGDSEAQDQGTVTIFDLPVARVNVCSLAIRIVNLPAFGIVRTPLSITYELTNRTRKVQEFLLEMPTSETFMLSGNKQVHLKVLPLRATQIHYTLYPMCAGPKVLLPRLHLKSLRIHSQIQDCDQILDRMLPSTITVLPRVISCIQ